MAVTIEKAVKIVENFDKKLKPISAGETKDWFKFCMAVKDSNELLGNGCSLCVNKRTGSCSWRPVYIDGDKDYNYGLIKIYSYDDLYSKK